MPRPKNDPDAPKLEGRAAFRAQAERRMTTAIKALANVAKLPRKHMTGKDADAFVRALEAQVGEVKARLASTAAEAPVFKLDE